MQLGPVAVAASQCPAEVCHTCAGSAAQRLPSPPQTHRRPPLIVLPGNVKQHTYTNMPATLYSRGQVGRQDRQAMGRGIQPDGGSWNCQKESKNAGG